MEITLLVSKLERMYSVLRNQRAFLVAELESDLRFVTFLENFTPALVANKKRRLEHNTSFDDQSRNITPHPRSQTRLNDSLSSRCAAELAGEQTAVNPMRDRDRSGSVKSLLNSKRMLSVHKGKLESKSPNDSQLGILVDLNSRGDSFHSQKAIGSLTSSQVARAKPELGIHTDNRDTIESRHTRNPKLLGQASPSSVLSQFKTPKTAGDSLNKKIETFGSGSASQQNLAEESHEAIIDRNTFDPTQAVTSEMLLAGNKSSNQQMTPTVTPRTKEGKSVTQKIKQSEEKILQFSVLKTNSGVRTRHSTSVLAEVKMPSSTDTHISSWKQKLGVSADKPTAAIPPCQSSTNPHAQQKAPRKMEPIPPQQLRQTISVENNLLRLTSHMAPQPPRPSVAPKTPVGELRVGARQLMSLLPDRPDISPISPNWHHKAGGGLGTPQHEHNTQHGGQTNIYVKRLKISMNEPSARPANAGVVPLGSLGSVGASVSSGDPRTLPTRLETQTKAGSRGTLGASDRMGSAALDLSAGSGITKFKTALIDVLGGSLRKGSLPKP